MWSRPITFWERLASCAPYLLPMAASAIYGGVLVEQFPVLLYGLLPLFWLYKNILSFPVIPAIGISGEFIIFLGFYFGLVRNRQIPHFIRFNTMQAILLQVFLFIAQVLLQLLGTIFNDMLPKAVGDVAVNTIFLGTVTACVYAIYKALRGQYAEIPTLSQAALIQCSDAI
jgi:uncharacterized membrane protein